MIVRCARTHTCTCTQLEAHLSLSLVQWCCVPDAVGFIPELDATWMETSSGAGGAAIERRGGGALGAGVDPEVGTDTRGRKPTW